MQKKLEGNVISLKMGNTAIVEITRRVAHPLYRKLMKRSKKYKVETGGIALEVGQRVKIGSIRPMSKEKYFKILTIVK